MGDVINIEGKTDKQLQEMCIASWEHRLKLSIENIQNSEEGLGHESCAFCARYYTLESNDCLPGCPVKLKTGQNNCLGTPHNTAANAYFEIEYRGHLEIKLFHDAAQEEVDFLKALECDG